MPALLERPKLSNAMARALHKHIMKERERKRQEEEEVDKMMEQKMKEEEERKRTKEMEERMSLEETKEQVKKMGGNCKFCKRRNISSSYSLKKVLHEEERRRRKEQSDITALPSSSYQSTLPLHSGQRLLSIQGSPVSHSRASALLGERSKQLFQTPLIPGHHFSSQPGFPPGSSEYGQFSGSSAVHEPYAVTQAQHHSSYRPAVTVPISFAGTTQIRGTSPFQSMSFLPHQPQGYAVQSHFSSQPGFIPSASLSLQKQLEHANQQSGFTDSAALRSMHPQALHVSAAGLLPNPSMAVQIPTAKSSPQPASQHAFLSHAQAGQRFYHHGKPH